MNIVLTGCYLLLALSLFIYSYGFVDFNLTLSSHPVVTGFTAWSQTLAMFNRPLSVRFYLVTVLLSYFSYLLILRRRPTHFPWTVVVILALVSSLSYPFLSSDSFKYLFSARMLVDYGLNPHLVAPMDVPGGDLWLRFMRWIHTPSPYGPVMTALAVPYYLLGFKRFTPALYLYKLDQAAWYLLAIYLIGKLAARLKLSPSRQVLAQLFFALNPLIIIEWLTNAHNDAPMFTLLLLSIYLLSLSKRLWALITLLLSVGIKYVTIVFLPFILLRRPKFTLLFSLYLLFFTFTLAPYLYHYTSQFQPWYITWLVPFAALLSPTLMWATAAYTAGGLLRYLPFIATGLWSATPREFALLTYTPLVLTVAALLLQRGIRRL